MSSLVSRLTRWPRGRRLWPTLPIAALVLLLAYSQGRQPTLRTLILLAALSGGATLLRYPALGLPVLLVAALAVPLKLGTGTEVALYPSTLLIPVLGVLWLLDGLRRRDLHVAPSRLYRPLLLFLLCGLLSLAIGTVLWDPLVPRSRNILLVQLAQWAIFAFAALALWLPAHLRLGERGLRRLTYFALVAGGMMALLRVLPGVRPIFYRLATGAVDRAPFWMWLTALAGGQLLYNRQLGRGWRMFLVAVLAAVVYYAFEDQQEAVSTWLGVAAVAGVLGWLRFPRLRGWIMLGVAVLMLLGVLFPALWNFAGGEDEWNLSGNSRLTLITRVVEVTLRNPLTGLGPAAYRAYAAMRPLAYGRALWRIPAVNSHNNYVDLFAHTGLLGLGLFLWFMGELAWLGWRLRARQGKEGFRAGFVNGMLAAWAGAMAIMALADWMLPHVYNIGFHGFQASVLVWLFLGGLVALENMPTQEDKAAI